MKKVLIIQNGYEVSSGIFEFAKKLNDIEPIFLTGFFLPELADVRTEGKKVLDDNIGQFKQMCAEDNIAHTTHEGSVDLYARQMIRETIFADLVIISSEIFFKDFLNATGFYTAETGQYSKCPVVIVPEKYSFPNNIILSYNEDPSSVYAIKQFAHLLPELCTLPAELVYAGNEQDDIPYCTFIEELVSSHFPNLIISKFDVTGDDDFPGWVANKENVILVAGAYHRSSISELFKKGPGQYVLKEHTPSAFAAHL